MYKTSKSTGWTILHKLLQVDEILCRVRYGSSLETHIIIHPVKGTSPQDRQIAVHQSPREVFEVRAVHPVSCRWNEVFHFWL